MQYLHVAHFDEDKVITALKALGNTGSPKALKCLRRLLLLPIPGRIETTRMQVSAVQALRLIVNRDPQGVRTPLTIYNTRGTFQCLKSMHT